ncbi:MAG: 2-C-methyl-D-erythritol 2,4-cyclodiphosphate synthase [Dokdonella sp.]|nr:MAG: 2-C-methyl-D-erythritol 2,4-cyclodiphosphate synthase [Dokdonella sp.]
MRIGQGFDVHAFGPGDYVTLGGVRIAHDHGLVAHSDGDVVIHALCDAMLGALALGDIGQHFPPGEEQWRNADSRTFLRRCAALVAQHGHALANADVTVVCERPRLAPHVERMREALAGELGCALDQVSVKATTSEKLGFTGRGEGIAASAVVLLQPRAVAAPVAGEDDAELHAFVQRVAAEVEADVAHPLAQAKSAAGSAARSREG